MQKFYKGRTNNHLTWVMVDATDFATPESALSAATKIKIYGKLRAAAGVNFVSSGTGSLTNDIQHVGASALGLYSIGLVKADLSDASAAWYDQYIISLSATGAAYQALIVDGGIDESAISDLISNAYSAALQANSRVLLTQSMASDAASAAAQANSRVLLVQSRLSDLDSRLTSDVSDIVSALVALSDATSNAYSAAVVGASRILLVQSRLSDFDSRLVSDVSDIRSMLTALSDAISDAHSDLASKIGGVTATLGASDISDIASAVWAHATGARVDSRVLLVQSFVSDIRSHVSDLQSDFQSRVPKLVATNSQLSDLHSDLKSAIGNVSVTLTASDISDIASAVAAAAGALTASEISDIASAVWAHAAGARVDSRILVAQSFLSDIRSHVSDLQSDFQSRVPKLVANNSQVSALLSDVLSALAAGVPVAASDMSDLRSAITAGGISQSGISDIASAVADTLASRLSDILSAAQQGNSRVLAVQSQASDIYSLLSDAHSDLGVLSGIVSDVYSRVTAPVDASMLSDIASAVWARAGADPTAVVSPTGQMGAKLDYLTAMARNKITQTATVQSLRNDADSADIASAAVSDDGTTFVRGEFA